MRPTDSNGDTILKGKTKSDFGVRLVSYRQDRHLSQEDLAGTLGVTRTRILRWESGTSLPDPEIARILEATGFGKVEIVETNLASRPRLGLVDSAALRGAIRNRIRIGNGEYSFDPAPYVMNGPENQLEFFEELYHLQESSRLTPSLLARRLSAVAWVDGFEVNTSQVLLEKPRANAKHWNSNYGPHGWHRYVGRFPPHLIRALLNHFEMSAGDVVCDPFVGSGTTLVECRLLGLRGIGIEVCPLSALISRTKSSFPLGTSELKETISGLRRFYAEEWDAFTHGDSINDISYEAILGRKGNKIPEFENHKKWLTAEALLGCSLVVEYIGKLDGFPRDALATALSSRMRRIANVDVDVVRAEYRKEPRENVNVLNHVQQVLNRMISDIDACQRTHGTMISDESDINVIEASALDTQIEPDSIDCIITSPPYGVESVSYLRTHLLSYRTLASILHRNPYAFDDKIIGSEYLGNGLLECTWKARELSSTGRVFFETRLHNSKDEKERRRKRMMMHFFDQMVDTAERFRDWLKPGGRIAFIIGNKRIGKYTIPTDSIIKEIFEEKGLSLDRVVCHKLKCNNSNSEVPWQDRIIQDEFVMLFTKR